MNTAISHGRHLGFEMHQNEAGRAKMFFLSLIMKELCTKGIFFNDLDQAERDA